MVEPCSCHVDQEQWQVADNEVVIIRAVGTMGKLVILDPEVGFISSAYLVMFVGGRYRCGNESLRMRELNTLGPGASGLGLLSSMLSDHLTRLRCDAWLLSTSSRSGSRLRVSMVRHGPRRDGS